MKNIAFLLTLLITAASAQDTLPGTDWEGALADYMQAKGQAEIVGLWEALQRPDPKEARKRWDFLAAQFPVSSSTAKLAASRCAGLAEAQRWEELLTAVPDLVRRYPDYPSTHSVAITALERVVTKAEVTEALRLKALRTLVPLVKQRTLVVRGCLVPLTKLSLPEDERYRLGCELEESCGTSPGMREFRWRMVEFLAGSASPEVVRAACEAFSKRYGAEHMEGRSAERLLLTLEKTPGAKKRLADMAKEDKASAAQLKAALTATQQALAKGDVAEVNSALAPLAKIQPAYAAEGTWSTLVQSKEFAAAPVAVRLALLQSLFEHTQAGAAQASAISVGVNLGRSQPAALKAVVKHLLANASDAQQAFAQFSVLQRFVRDAKDEELLRETYHAGAAMAQKLGVTDREVEYLTEFAQLIWDRDEAAAREALKRAERYWPRIPAAAQAGWFLAFLEGKLGVVQGALPREFKPAVNADAPLPVLAMPKLPAASSSCVTQGDTVEMAKADVKQNLMAGQPATLSDGAAVTNAVTDGDAKTLWQPAKTPAALLVPLGKSSTVERIRAQFTAPAYFVITLRDAKGRALAKVERDWGFWEHMRNTIHWPEADTTFNITPVPDVAAIEVQVFDGIGEVALVELEAFSSPYPVTARHEFAAQDIEAGAKRVRVTLDAAQPEVTTTIHADKESTRGYPIMRWLKPWSRSAQPVTLRTLNENIGVEFWGDSAMATIGGTGGARWSLDGQAVQESAPVKVTGAAIRELSVGGQTSGRHLLRLQSTNLPAARDEGGYNDVKLHQLSVKGRAAVRPLLRFINGKGESGDWQQPADDGSAAVPEKVRGEKTTRVQVAAFFDSRGAAGTATATVRGMKLAFDQETAAPAADFTSHAPSAFPEQLDAVLAGVKAREAVVVYAKTGTSREHAAAKALAERAGLYLVSDDIGLNPYSSPVIAVGTPLRHRYCRQLLATAGLWNDAAYLNDEDGVIGIERDDKGQPATYHLTGETPDAVVKAVERLLAKLPPRTEAPQPFRTFTSHTLEMIYPWQLHGPRTPPAPLEVRLGIQDRRSAQFGIAAEVPLDAVNIECGALTSAAGKTIPKVLVQTVGNYEWVPFFGDLRLPNLLVPNAPFSLPAHSTIGVWLTAITDATTPAGEYRGTLKVTAASQTQDVPVRVVVEPVALPNASEVGTYSFASVPYWFHQGTETWKRSLRELAANEAAQDVNTVSPVFHVELKPARHTVPVEMAVGPAESRADALKWQPHSSDAKEIAAGGALFLRFAKPVPMRDIAAVLKPAEDTRFILATASANGEWTTASEPTRQLCATWDERNRPRSQAQPEVLRFRVKPGTMNAAVWRITTQATGAFTAHSALAVTAEDDRWPFTADFSHFDEQMDIYDEEYRAQQRPLPVFLSQIHADELMRMSTDLFGSGGVGDTASWFAEMMVEHLGKTGRAKRFIAKVGDEPRDLVRWAQSAQPYRDGGLQTMTAHNTSYPDMNVGSGLINPWCPNYEHEVWKPFFHERRKQGDKVWWYECGIPNTRITGTPIDNLPFYWLTAKWRMDGAMNYAALHANKGSSMPLAFRYEHGMDHRMAHEKTGRLLDTTRRELEGDGIRDVKLITWVRHHIEALKPTQPERAKQLEQRLEAAIESVAPYRYGYPQDAELWHRARNIVYDIAVEVVK